MTKFGLNQLQKEPPSWVLPALVAATFVFQGLPPIISGYEIVGAKSKEAISLLCDVLNLLAAASALFFGKPLKKENYE